MNLKSTLIILIVLLSVGVGYSTTTQIDFVNPTYLGGSEIPHNYVETNVTITDTAISSIVYEWNLTNSTLYDINSVLMLNMNNISALGENDTYVVNNINGNKNNCSAIGNAITNVSGKYGNTFQFNGSSESYLGCGNDLSLNFTNYVTISAWVKLDSASAVEKEIVRKRQSGNHPYIMNIYTNKKARFGVYNGSWVLAESTSTLNANQWYFLVGTLNISDPSGNIKLYIDGVLNASVNHKTTFAITSTNHFRIGESFDGLIDEVGLWNRSLSASEVQQLYYSDLRKYDVNKWNLFTNNTGLSVGNYTVKAYTSSNSTDLRQFRVLASNRPIIENLTLTRRCDPESEIYYSYDYIDSENDPVGTKIIDFYNQTGLKYTSASEIFDDCDDNLTDSGTWIWAKGYDAIYSIPNTTDKMEGDASLQIISNLSYYHVSSYSISSTGTDINSKNYSHVTFWVYVEDTEKLLGPLAYDDIEDEGDPKISSAQFIVSNETDGSPYARWYFGDELSNGWNYIDVDLTRPDWDSYWLIQDFSNVSRVQFRFYWDDIETDTGILKLDDIRLVNNSEDIQADDLNIGEIVYANLMVYDKTGTMGNDSIVSSNISYVKYVPAYPNMILEDMFDLQNVTLRLNLTTFVGTNKNLTIYTRYNEHPTLEHRQYLLKKEVNLTEENQSVLYALLDDWQGQKFRTVPYSINDVCISLADPNLNVTSYEWIITNETYVPPNYSYKIPPLADIDDFFQYAIVEKTWGRYAEAPLYNQTVGSLFVNHRFTVLPTYDQQLNLGVLHALLLFNESVNGYANQTTIQNFVNAIDPELDDYFSTTSGYMSGKSVMYDRSKTMYEITGNTKWLDRMSLIVNATYSHNVNFPHFGKYHDNFRCSYGIGVAYNFIDYGNITGNNTLIIEGLSKIDYMENACRNTTNDLYFVTALNDSGIWVNKDNNFVIGKNALQAEYYTRIYNLTGNSTFMDWANRTLYAMNDTDQWRDQVNGGWFTGFRDVLGDPYPYKTPRDISAWIKTIDVWETIMNDHTWDSLKAELIEQMELMHSNYNGFPYRTNPDYTDYDGNGTWSYSAPRHTSEATQTGLEAWASYIKKPLHFNLTEGSKAKLYDTSDNLIDDEVPVMIHEITNPSHNYYRVFVNSTQNYSNINITFDLSTITDSDMLSQDWYWKPYNGEAIKLQDGTNGVKSMDSGHLVITFYSISINESASSNELYSNPVGGSGSGGGVSSTTTTIVNMTSNITVNATTTMITEGDHEPLKLSDGDIAKYFETAKNILTKPFWCMTPLCYDDNLFYTEFFPVPIDIFGYEFRGINLLMVLGILAIIGLLAIIKLKGL